jgi:hypothetical protein
MWPQVLEGREPYATPVYRKLFSPVAHPNLSKTHDGTPQNFASRKGGTKLYMAINMYLHTNPCPIGVQAYEKLNYRWWNSLSLRVCVCLRQCLSLCVCVCVCLCLSVFLSLSVCLSLKIQYIYIYIYMYVTNCNCERYCRFLTTTCEY